MTALKPADLKPISRGPEAAQGTRARQVLQLTVLAGLCLLAAAYCLRKSVASQLHLSAATSFAKLSETGPGAPGAAASTTAASTAPAALGSKTSSSTEANKAAGSPAEEVRSPGYSSLNVTRCSQVLGIKKVALLFLTVKPLPQEPTWQLWLWAAAGLVPWQALAGVQGAACDQHSPEAWQRIVAACSALQAQSPSKGTPPPQLLYSIYVHAAPSTAFPKSSMFAHHLIGKRVKTLWGDISLVEAERLLLAEALKHPMNERFVLVSESDIPLYDPLTFYQQLMSEQRSRVKATWMHSMSEERWRDSMQTARLKRGHWRKSSQFWSLMRGHAEQAVQDSEVYNAFYQHCPGVNRTTGQPMYPGCVPDEHYFPTLLAMLGLDNETYYGGWGIAAAEWPKGPPYSPHPIAFKPEEVKPALVWLLRRYCSNANASIDDAQSMFTSLDLFLPPSAAAAETTHHQQRQQHQTACTELQATLATSNSMEYTHQMGSSCYLLGRKFMSEAAASVYRLFLASCPSQPGAQATGAEGLGRATNNLRLLSGIACKPEVQEVIWTA